MGKVKRGRRKLHAPPKTSDKGRQSNVNEDMVVDNPVEATSGTRAVHPSRSGGPEGGANPFSGVRISKDKLLQTLPDFDARSTVTSKSLKGLGLKKKEKTKLKHQLWMEKMNAVEAAKKKEKERKRKEKTAVVGDLTDLQDTLPTLELLLKKGTTTTKQRQTQPSKRRGIEKESKRRKQMLKNIALFKQVLDHPAYKENPGSTISEHLKNKMKQSDSTIS